MRGAAGGPRATVPAELGADWHPDSSKFIRHWRSLRGADPMPTSEGFFDSPPAQLIPNIYVAELTGDSAIVRFQGDELINRWGRNFINVEIHDGRPDLMKARSLKNMRKLIDHPCGMLAKLDYTTSRARAMIAEMVQLPFITKPGRPP